MLRVDVYRVLWSEEGLTLTSEAAGPTGAGEEAVLLLDHRGIEYRMDSNLDRLRLGRERDNDLVVEGDRVSRWHAVVELKRDRYVLTDMSTNGTHVVIDGERPLLLRRKAFDLRGQGAIGLGQSPEPGARQSIGFRCVRLTPARGA